MRKYGEVKIMRGIFQGDSLSPLLFVSVMISLTHILRKSKPGYEFFGSGENYYYYFFIYLIAPDNISKTVNSYSTLIFPSNITKASVCHCPSCQPRPCGI